MDAAKCHQSAARESLQNAKVAHKGAHLTHDGRRITYVWLLSSGPCQIHRELDIGMFLLITRDMITGSHCDFYKYDLKAIARNSKATCAFRPLCCAIQANALRLNALDAVVVTHGGDVASGLYIRLW